MSTKSGAGVPVVGRSHRRVVFIVESMERTSAKAGVCGSPGFEEMADSHI